MRNYQNPFRSRASEQQRDTYSFLRYFGVAVLDLLPETIWDRPLIIRSAAGGGKTTLLRAFTAESLLTAHTRREDLEDLATKLDHLDALCDEGPKRFGLLLNLGRDYRTLANSGAPEEIASRLFLRLLDARILVAAVRGALTLAGVGYPEGAARLEFRPRHDDDRSGSAASRLGGRTGNDIIEASRHAEEEIVDLLDSLLPVDWNATTRGHAELYSLRLLSDSDIFVDEQLVDAQPLLLLDDGHELTGPQRTTLLTALLDRDITVARWYAERFEALQSDELLQDDTAGRDYELLELERALRDNASAGRRRFDRLLHEVGNLRAGWHLERYTHGARDFFDYLEEPGEDMQPDTAAAARAAAAEAAGDHPVYQRWLVEADVGTSYDRAVRIRASQILMERYRRRPQQPLFDMTDGTSFDSLIKSDVREAARLFLSREHGLAYYAGQDAVTSLASHNVEQFLRVCGDLFEHMLGMIALNQTPTIDAARQQLIIRKASDQFWREIPARLPNSRDVLRLLTQIIDISVSETNRPTAPYAPGVTGIAITWLLRVTF
jgi:hypothetical protein